MSHPDDEPTLSPKTQVFREPNRLGAETDPCLILIAHPEKTRIGARYPIGGESVTVGRSERNPISFPAVATLSRRHARFERVDGRSVVTDLGSTNGTRVNGRRISRPTALLFGDRVQLGQVHLKYLEGPDVERNYHELVFELANSDPLTGIANRRRFSEEASAQVTRSLRNKEPLSLILFDVDRFKDLNDTFGHPVGDLVLRSVVETCSKLLPQEATFARLGGDEFGILCPGHQAPEATELATRLRDAVRDLESSSAGPALSVSCSFGVAQLGEDALAFNRLEESADKALYQAKKLGGNHVCPS